MSIVSVLAVIFGLKEIASHGLGPMPIAFVIVGVIVGIVFVRRQLRLPDPMLDVRLFRIPTFRAALTINFLTVLVAVGYFLFVAQYLQLVLGLSPLEAGLWSVPSAIGFVVGSNAAPRILRYVRPARLMGAGLLLAALGLAILTQVGGDDGLAVVVAASLIISLGLAPVFGLTTEFIVGSAPTERAGAASGISETGAELGGALGIAVLGSIGVALYRREIGASLPADIPQAAADAAMDTLGGAVAAAASLPAAQGAALVEVARAAFVQGMVTAALICAVVAVAVAILALVSLRDEISAAPDEAGPHPTTGSVPSRGEPQAT
jgi:DHA2 family multidrug resistance protein-like MFS transporter